MIKEKISQDILLQRLKKGHEFTLSAIYKEYWEIMFLAAFNLVKNKEV